MGVFTGQTVAVTGAGGSIGMQLCRAALEQRAERLVLISLTEGGLYEANKRLLREYPEAQVVPVLGSYGNRMLMRRTLEGVDMLVHAGAHKHVPICEANAMEAIANNVLGTATLLEVASDKVQRVVVISTDKAVNPQSVMGMTKRVVEKLAVQHAKWRADISVVRFGNVLDSAGSVVPLWREQIAAGGPLTLTDERCERYFMSIPEAVELITHAIAHGASGGIYVLQMGERVKLLDVARRMIAEAGRPIDIHVTGLRPGEKLVEEISHGGDLLDMGNRVSMVVNPCMAFDPGHLEELGAAYRRDDRSHALQLLRRLAA